jgi:TetR/AcrR family transcriptional repressor of nem operon
MTELKQNIIHESLKLFSLKGFSNASMTDILSASGTSKGGFYNHFKSKEDLFFQVLEEAKQIWRQKNLDGLNQIDAPIEKIIRFLENFKDKYLKDAENFPGGCVFITLSVDLKNQRPNLSEEINKGFTGFKAMLKRFLKKAQENGELKNQTNIDAVIEIIFSTILGISVTYSLDNSDKSLDYSIGSLINYVNSNRN